jgi:signal transduction histidine kinase
MFDYLTRGKLLYGIKYQNGTVDFRSVEKEISLSSSQFKVDDIVKAIIDLIGGLYNQSKLAIGESATEEIFESALRDIKEKYIRFSAFSEIVKSLPKGILETEKFDILSKEDLERVAVELKRTDVMKSEFTNIAAHELKTPIVPLKGFLSMLDKNPEKYGLNREGQEFIKVCLRNADRLNALIGDILDISKLEAGEMKFEMADVDLMQLLKNSATDASVVVKEKKLEFKLILPESLPIVTGDAQRLSQVIGNLIGNSTKFTDKGSITLKAHIEGDHVQIDVIDTGVGISPENVPKLFMKFYQTEQAETRRNRGTGLGLAISKEIVEAHGGKIWAQSEGLGKGSIFSMTLPIKKSA